MAWSVPRLGTLVESGTGNFDLIEPVGVVQGDLMIACIAYRSNAVITQPAGWSVVATQQNSGDTDATNGIGSGAMFYIVRGASAPDLTCVRTGGDVAVARVISYSGNTSTPYDTGTANTLAVASQTVTTGTFSTAEANELIVAMAAGGDNYSASAFDATDPATASGATDTTTAPTAGTWIERQDSGTNTGADTSLAIADAIRATAGATGTIQVTLSGSGRSVMIAGAFKMTAALTQSFSDSINNLADAYTQVEGQRLTLADDANLWTEYFTYGRRPRWLDSQSQALGEDSAARTLTLSDDLNNWGDAYTQIEGQQLTFAESINNLADAYSQIGNGLADYSDNLNAWADYFVYGRRPRWQDAESHQVGGGAALTLTFAESIDNWADAYAQIEDHRFSFTDDSNNLSDAFSQILEFRIPVSDDTNLLAESLSMIEGELLAFTDDANNLLDLVNKIEELRPAFSDSFTITDSCGLGYGLGCADGSNTLADSATTQLSQALTLTDSFALSDSVNLFEAGFLSFGDSFTLLDAYSQEGQVPLVCQDSFTLTDSISLLEQCLLGLSDLFTLTDSFAAQFDYFLGLSDSFSLSDSMVFSAGGGGDLVFAEALVFSDSFVVALGLLATGEDSLNNWNDMVNHNVPFPSQIVRVKRDERTVIVEP